MQKLRQPFRSESHRYSQQSQQSTRVSECGSALPLSAPPPLPPFPLHPHKCTVASLMTHCLSRLHLHLHLPTRLTAARHATPRVRPARPPPPTAEDDHSCGCSATGWRQLRHLAVRLQHAGMSGRAPRSPCHSRRRMAAGLTGLALLARFGPVAVSRFDTFSAMTAVATSLKLGIRADRPSSSVLA